MSAALSELLAPVRGWFRGRPAPPETPEETFRRVIGQERECYVELKGAVAQLMFVKHRLAGEVHEQRAEIARLHAIACKKCAQGDTRGERSARARIEQLHAEVREGEEILAAARADAEEAATALLSHGGRIDALTREQRRVMAVLVGQAARGRIRRLTEARRGDEASDVNLVGVREKMLAAWGERLIDRELERSDP